MISTVSNKPKHNVFSSFQEISHTGNVYSTLRYKRNHRVEEPDLKKKVIVASGSAAATLLPIIYFAKKHVDTIETKLTEAAMEYPDIRYSATLVADTDAGVRVWGCTHCTGDGTSNTAGTIAIDFSGTAPQKVNLAYDRSTGKLSGKVKYVNGCWQINATTSNLTDISTSDTAFCGTDF